MIIKLCQTYHNPNIRPAYASNEFRCLFDIILTHLAQVVWRLGLQVQCPRTSGSHGDEGNAEEGDEGSKEG